MYVCVNIWQAAGGDGGVVSSRQSVAASVGGLDQLCVAESARGGQTNAATVQPRRAAPQVNNTLSLTHSRITPHSSHRDIVMFICCACYSMLLNIIGCGVVDLCYLCRSLCLTDFHRSDGICASMFGNSGNCTERSKDPKSSPCPVISRGESHHTICSA